VTAAVAGLTGGIGSGKSTVAGMFADMGVPVLDLDRVGHEILAADGDVRTQFIQAFGEGILKRDGSIDRRKLAEKAFASGKSTATINAIEHPAIWLRAEKWLASQTAPYVIIEASVLIESGSADRADAVVVVLAGKGIRRQRALSRPGPVDEAMFTSIIARQCSDAERVRAADIIIRNDGSMRALRTQVEKIHAELTQRFRPCG